MERVAALQAAFAELKTDMLEEVKDIDRKLIIPAKLAKDALKPIKKSMKKRDDAKVRCTRSRKPAVANTACCRLTTSATRAAAKLSKRRRPAQSARTLLWPSMKLTMNALRKYTTRQTIASGPRFPG